MSRTATRRLHRLKNCCFLLVACCAIVQGAVFRGAAPSSYAGTSVAVSPSGTLLAMGAPNHQPSGRVQVFARNIGEGDVISEEWIQRGSDLVPGAHYGTDEKIRSGSAVALSETSMVAIGSPNADLQRGRVDIYEWKNESWNTVGQTLVGAAPQDLFGCSLALSGDGTVLAVGARLNDDNGDNSGHVKVFLRAHDDNGASQWIQRGGVIEGEGDFDGSGFSVSISSNGKVLAIGAPANQNYQGHVRTFAWKNDVGNWVERGGSIVGDAEFDFLGWSVDLSSDGSVLAIGAPYHDATEGFENTGQVKIYEWRAEAWHQLGESIDGEEEKEAMGNSVALSPGGTQLAIGSSQGKASHGPHAGHVKVFRLVDNTWIRQEYLLEGEMQGDRFGHSLALASNGLLVVGVRQSNANAGHVATFDLR